MHLVFDARHLSLPYSGLGRYASSLLLGVLRLEDSALRPARCTVLVTPEVPGHEAHGALMAELAVAPNWTLLEVDQGPFSSVLQRQTVAAVNGLDADHYIYPHYDVPLGIRPPLTFVIHDLMPIRLKGYIRQHVWLKQAYFHLRGLSSLRSAQTCITVSETTRYDVLDSFGHRFADKVVSVHSGIPDRPAEPAPRQIEGPYLLYVGDRRPHKNLPKILALFEALRREHGYGGQLVMSGPRSNHGFDPEDYAANRDLPVIFPGAVPDAVLEAYYRDADAHMLISDYEGFGLPVIEAARHGTKTIVSSCGALPEIAPKGALVLSEPYTIEEGAAQIAAYLDGSARPDGTAVEAQFRWEHTARRVLETVRNNNQKGRA